MTENRDVLWWLRLVLLAVVAVLSMVFGIEPGLDPRNATVGELIRVIVETTDEGIADRGGVQALAELVSGPEDEIDDEFLGEIEDEPLPDLPPLDDEPPSGVASNPQGGVIGGGVAEVPSETETPGSDPTMPPAAPTMPLAAPMATAIPTNSPTLAATATSTASPTPSATVVPTDTPIPTVTATAMPDPTLLRLDDPVLRWLPELRAASAASGLPVSLLAAIVQVESNGDPNPIGVDGGRGLTGVPGDVLAAQGWAVESWHDPAVNTLSGAFWMSSLVQVNGTPDAALRQAWGPNCDAIGQCAGLYAYAVLAWEQYYARIVGSPEASGIAALPVGWTPPAISPLQEAGPRSIVLPPGVDAPAPTVAPTEPPVPSVTPVPTVTPSPTETPAEFESGASPET